MSTPLTTIEASSSQEGKEEKRTIKTSDNGGIFSHIIRIALAIIGLCGTASAKTSFENYTFNNSINASIDPGLRRKDLDDDY